VKVFCGIALGKFAEGLKAAIILALPVVKPLLAVIQGYYQQTWLIFKDTAGCQSLLFALTERWQLAGSIEQMPPGWWRSRKKSCARPRKD